jgi:NAD(P)-dependent dehydrogenase (short-subunit alcohol dehydrogenase family)
MPEKVAIVTAAGRGIGEACARELHARGYKLSLISPSGSAEMLAKTLGGIGFTGSITEEKDVERMVKATLDRWGRVDAVVNNAGRHASVLSKYGHQAHANLMAQQLGYDAEGGSDLLDLPDGVWHDILDVQVLNVVRMCRHVTPAMVKQGGGAIVNISGIEAMEPRLIFSTGPIRLALHGITKLYSDRYGKDGVRMNTVVPGFLENVDVNPGELRKAIPIPRLGKLGEIAKTVAFLLSDDAGYVTGQNWRVDGGLNRAL